MKEQTEINDNHFLNTERGKAESNAIEVPSITLPKGGGAIKGIDEKFFVNAVNGTASFSLPLPFSAARGTSPELSLSYSSGAGNGIFGLGWNLSLGSIKRKTDIGLPQYLDSVDSDTFLFSEAEDLVPEFKKNQDGSFPLDDDGDYILNERPSSDGLFTIRNYKPRIEGLFARIERWTKNANGRIKWRVITRDNITTLFGWTDNSIIFNPEDPSKIYQWLPEFVFDDKGNCSHYMYRKEDSVGFDESLLHNRNRIKNGEITYTNCYLEKVLYGNKKPYNGFGNDFPIEDDYLFSTVFDYGEYNTASPYDKINDWTFRSDAFSNYKAGFEIRTTRLCQRVLFFHHFKGEDEYDGLVRSVNFEYDTSTEQDFTFLKAVNSYGYIKKPDGSYSHKKLPPLEFDYQKHDWNEDIKTIANEDLIHAPAGLDEQQYQFTDLFNEGLSGILTEQGNGWYYKHNLGDGKFEQAKLVTPKPSFTGLEGQLQLADLDADGGKQIVSRANGMNGFFELDDEDEWRGFQSFEAIPNIDFADPNTRMLDLNGDGKPEVVISEDNVFTWYESEGRNGYAAARKTPKSFDEESGPHIVFADSTQSIFLADMSGDGMTDIVRIRNSDVCYWPNLGYGKFGAKVALDNAPVFDHPDVFNPTYLRFADIDGSGNTDIIYLGKNKFTCWKNLSGNRFSTLPFEIDNFPEIHSHSKITVTDLLGNGVACIVWSSPLAKDANSSLKYIDLMNSRKPHIMVSYKNNMGKEVALKYTPSTTFYLEDKKAGKPWVTKLHFPVHCISKTVTEDKISGYKFVSQYKYHHGYYDHAEREFRGFGMVEQIDSETFEHWVKGEASNIVEKELHQEPVITKTWNHTGAFLQKDKILNQFADDYWYEEMQRAGFAATHHEVALRDARLVAAEGLDEIILDSLSSQEWQEAMRACKGMTLRSEIFARDSEKYGNTPEAMKRELTPYTVSSQNCFIQLLQPKGNNDHAVFTVMESEAVSYSYERNPEDPRIAHSLNIKLGDYGNVLESAEVVYPRHIRDTDLPEETQDVQKETIIIYHQHHFTNDVLGDDIHLLRLPSEVKTYELKGVSKTNAYYTPSDFIDILTDAKSDSAYYHELDKPLEGKAQKRVIEHVRSTYYKNDLTGALPLHHLESLALPYESFQLAYTPELIKDLFENRVNDIDNIMTDGKFTNSEGDANWWIRSGTAQYLKDGESLDDAKSRFFQPVSFTDPFKAVTKVSYYGDNYLFIEKTEDAIGNKTRVDQFNFRTLSPQRMRDINNNISEIVSNELGFVKALAVKGKGNEADDLIGITEIAETTEQTAIDDFFQASDSLDLTPVGKALLQKATTRFVYDFNAYIRSGKPTVVASINREQHYKQDADSPVQIGFEYTNGLGEAVMQKVQAEPGLAKQVITDENGAITIEVIDTTEQNPTQLRWIGNGRTIKNNIGNTVKQYEPYFSVTHQFEDVKELVESGVTPLMYYDAAGRLIKTEMPDGTFSKVEFDSWKQAEYDANDAVLESEWYLKRTDNTRTDFISDSKEQAAANKASKHANTPNVQYFDTLGRPVLSVEHNINTDTEDDEFYHTKVQLDTEGNLRSVTDARGNTVMQYKYDMLDNLVYENSMDAGKRWMLNNIASNPHYIWDENDRVLDDGSMLQEKRIFRSDYDVLQRPLEQHLKVNEDEWKLIEKIVYGETYAEAFDRNLRGQVFEHYDSAGLITNQRFDFKGNLQEATRQLTQTYYVHIVDWNVEDPSQETFIQKTAYDALNRMTELKNWHLAGRLPGIYTPQYNDRGMLKGETLSVDGQVTEDVHNVEYNAKGQKTRVQYGNGTTTRYHYDEENFRLKQLRTTRTGQGDKLPTVPTNLSDAHVLQNLYYTYDPVGNITEIFDDAYEPVFFNNQQVEPRSKYKYDALYRLIQAKGRENNQATDASGQFDPKPFEVDLPITDRALRNYTQNYTYDALGNILKMKHVANGGSWTRNYAYADDSNRLLKTWFENNEADAIHYKYDRHGSMLNLGNTSEPYRMQWDYRDMIHRASLGGGGTAFYNYGSNKERTRKRIERNGNGIEERLYLGGFELYRKWEGGVLVEEIETHHLIADEQRLLITEHVLQTNNNLNTGILYRYQYSNHLGSASLELDGYAHIISYEEYHPYGTSAYQARNKSFKATAKRYRYTGMERDGETGLAYHSARYFLPWLGRWCSTDPIGIGDGVNVYSYVRNQTTRSIDINGKQRYQYSERGLISESIDDEEEFSEECTYDAVADLGHSIEHFYDLKEEVGELYELHSSLNESFDQSVERLGELLDSDQSHLSAVTEVDNIHNQLLEMEDEIDNLKVIIEITRQSIISIHENYPEALNNLVEADNIVVDNVAVASTETPQHRERSISQQEYYERIYRQIQVGRAIASHPTAAISATTMKAINPNSDFGDERNHARITGSAGLMAFSRNRVTSPLPHTGLHNIVVPQTTPRLIGSQGPNRGGHSDRQVHTEDFSSGRRAGFRTQSRQRKPKTKVRRRSR
ncbi:MAG: VCBS repeat-containing protein [Balneolaceae bacterium]|nr:VCBS repeat-containing protein [Balneolaceae bacterium]